MPPDAMADQDFGVVFNVADGVSESVMGGAGVVLEGVEAPVNKGVTSGVGEEDLDTAGLFNGSFLGSSLMLSSFISSFC